MYVGARLYVLAAPAVDKWASELPIMRYGAGQAALFKARLYHESQCAVIAGRLNVDGGCTDISIRAWMFMRVFCVEA